MSDYIKYHLAISSARYLALKESGALKTPAPGRLNVLEIKPDYETFALLLDRVGGPWAWTRRPCYVRNNRPALVKLLKEPHTRLFLLREDETVLGYCLTVAPDLDQGILDRMDGAGEPCRFRPRVIEIENFGLFPEHTGKKYGRAFLPAMLDKLFADHDAVYLSTRSTNHARVVPFYESLGFSVIHQETLPDDLIPAGADGQDLPATGT